MKHLTRIPKDETKPVKAYALYASVTIKGAQVVSDALVAELGEDSSGKKSAYVCNCVVSGVREPIAQERNKHALEILRSSDTPSLRHVEMALDGWPTKNTKEFVDEDSPEYRAWLEEQDNE